MTTVLPPAQGCRLAFDALIPFVAPAVFSAFRNVRLICGRERDNKTSRVAFGYDWDAVPVLSSSWSSQGRHQELHSVSSKGIAASHMSASLSVFLSGDQGGLLRGIPILPNKCRCSMRVQARKSSSDSLRYPAQTKKPEWWWRTLACVPYLISLQISDTGFFVQPLLNHYEKFEDLIYFIPGAVKRWSIWFPMLYCYFSFIGVVKNKEWPHFFRYHLIMAMLLERSFKWSGTQAISCRSFTSMGLSGCTIGRLWRSFTFFYHWNALGVLLVESMLKSHLLAKLH